MGPFYAFSTVATRVAASRSTNAAVGRVKNSKGANVSGIKA
jgi:hypothetical protein